MEVEESPTFTDLERFRLAVFMLSQTFMGRHLPL